MRIALVHMRHAHSGGTERYLSQLAVFLAEHGHAVTIVCRSHVEAPHPEVRFVELRPLAVGGAWRMWAFARAVEGFVAARRGDFDLIVGLGKTWSHDVMRLGGGVQRTYLELAHAATLSGLDRTLGGGGLKQRVACAIEDRALRPGAAQRWICNSSMVRDDVLTRFGLAPADVAVVHNGVDLELFHPRKRATEGRALRRALEIGHDQLLVLFLGTGYGRKGLDETLSAFAQVQRSVPRAQLVVVGFDSQLARYRTRAKELGIEDACRFLGGRGDAPACFAAADLYVLPTLYDPFANSTLEALASGVPVITTATNGAAELLREGVHGAVLPRARTPAAASDALREWLDPARIAGARAAARELAEEHSVERAMGETLALLEAAARA